MRERGQIFGVKLGGTRVFKMVPWAFGIYEFQLPHLDREFVELNEQFYGSFGRQFFGETPQLMQTLPIEEEIASNKRPYPTRRFPHSSTAEVLPRQRMHLQEGAGSARQPVRQAARGLSGHRPGAGRFRRVSHRPSDHEG